jgi:hypothetical protein
MKSIQYTCRWIKPVWKQRRRRRRRRRRRNYIKIT